MRKLFTLKSLLLAFVFVFGTLRSSSQQVLGTFPYMDGGFEAQNAGVLGTSLSTTAWSRQSQSGASSTILTTSPRSGSKYGSVTNVATVSRGLQSPQSSNSTDGPAASTSYVIQYYIRNSSTVSSFQSGNVTVNGTSNPGTYPTAGTLPINTNWTLQTSIISTPNSAVTTAGIGIAGRSGVGSFDVDDFVIYPGSSVDVVVPNSPSNVIVNNATNNSLNVGWTSASGGIDGGGYVVIRYTVNPNADNDPNQNGIYAVGNTTSNGTGNLTGTVRYIGTGTSFTDNVGLSSGTTYYYKIYTVDKAFNYSTESQGNGSTSTPLISTTTSLTSSPNPSTYNQNVVLTATVNAASGTSTGNVTFYDGVTSLGTINLSGNVASLNISSLTTGSHNITATYNGDGNYAISTSSILTQTVNQNSTTTSLASTQNPSTTGQSVTFTATISTASGTATGTVSFYDGSTLLGTNPITGTTASYSTSSLSQGSHTVTATYNSDVNYSSSTSLQLSQVVNAGVAASTSTSLSSSLNPSIIGQSVTFTATIATASGTPTGTVSFYDGATLLGTNPLSGTTATYNTSALSSGSHNITATYNGDANYAISTSSTLIQTVNLNTTFTSVSSNLNPSSFGQSVTFTATVTASGASTGTVSFYDGTTLLGTNSLSGTTAIYTTSALTGGSHNITATYNGDANYAASTSSALVQTINQNATSTALASTLNPSSFGQSVTFTATITTASGTPTGTVSFYDGATLLGNGNVSGTSATYTTASLTIGSHNMSATYNADVNNTSSTSAVLIQVVNKVTPTTTVTSSLNPSLTGQSVTFTATITAASGTPTGTVSFYDGTTLIGSGSLSGTTATYATSGLNEGSHSITATYSGDANNNTSTSTGFGQIVTTSASVKLLEDFNYSAGTALNTLGFVSFSGTGTNNLNVTSTGLMYDGSPSSGVGNAVAMATSGEDVSKSFSPSFNSGNAYTSFLVNVTSAQSTGDYFFSFYDAGGYKARIWIKSTTGGYLFGISKNSNTVSYETTVRSLNTTYLIVLKYVFNTSSGTDDVVSLYINPAQGLSEPSTATIGATSSGGANDASNIDRIALRQGSTSSASTQIVDGIRVGTTWESVTPVSSPTTTSISPTSANQGAPSFNLTVNGTNFTNTSIVTFNGNNKVTTYVSSTQLTAAILSTDLSTAGSYPVVVTTPGAASVSNTQIFTVNSVTGGTFTLTTALPDFGNVCINTTAGPNSFVLDGSNLDGSNNHTISISSLNGFSYSLTSGGTYTSTLDFTYTGNSFTGQIIYVKFSPTATQSYNGNIILNGGGVSNYPVAVTGAGVNNAPSITTGGSTSVGASTAVLSGSINNIGCAAITSYGIEYSPNSGFANGSGMQVFSTNLNSGNFSSNITGLTPNTRYYYKAFATNNIGTTYGNQQAFTCTPLPVPMASQTDLSFTETFADIANWSNFFITGIGANHFGGLSATGSGGIPNGTTITASTQSFQGAAFGSSGGVQKGTDQIPSMESIVLLSTGASPDNSTSAAIDFYMDFTGVNAGTISYDWASINNSTGDRKGSMRVYGSVDGVIFTEVPNAAVLNFTNNSATNGSITNIALPSYFNNNANARLRFYYYNGNGGTTGSRPKISIDNLNVTAVATTPCSTPTVQPTSIVFSSITDASISGSFTSASPASDQYLTVASNNSSLTSNPVDGVTYSVGESLGDGTVIAKGNSTSFTASNLSSSSTYYFFTFAVNGICTGGPKYDTISPLTGSATTASPLPNCTAPAAQPTNLTFGTTTTNSIQSSFTATTADEYLVLKSLSSSLSTNPVNGQSYTSGDIIGNATVIQKSTATSFTAAGLLPSTQYYFYVFSLNSQNCINGPTYNTTSPLTGSQSTQPLPPCVSPSSQPTYLTLNASRNAVSGAFTSSSSADDYLIIISTSSSLSAAPTDNTDYAVGSNLGGGVVIANDSVKSFVTNNLSPATIYYFFIFSENKNCSGGTKYFSTNPLTGNIITSNALVNNYYFGTLHSHSAYSDGNKDHLNYTPADDYNYAMSSQCMDFLGISEHNHFSSPQNPGNIITNYHQGIIQADNFTASHPNFLAMYGQEWGVISGGGHVVVYGDYGLNKDYLFGWESDVGGITGPNYDVYVPKSVYTGSTGLFKNINDSVARNTFATLAHPNLSDYNNLANVPYDNVADDAITGSAVESGPATSTNMTYSNPGSSMYYLFYYQTLLAKGYHLGPTIDHDNHNTTFGHTTYSRTAVLAPSLSKTEIVKGMRNMHFYATEDCDSKVDFTINTKMMGTVFSDRNAPAISAILSDATTNTSSAIMRIMFGIPGSGMMPVKIDSVIGNTLYFIDNNLSNGSTGYYYLDITNGSSRIVTSPIWYTRNDVSAPPVTTYYPRSSATDLSQISNWTNDISGTAGTSPANFASPNQLFNISRNPAVAGAWTISGGSNVILSVTGLTFNPTSSLTVGSGSNFDFGGNNNFTTTFKSIQTNTAYFGQLNGTISNATNITVERFISSQSNRAYRLLAPSVNTAGSSKQFIRDNWQEGTNNPNTSTINNPVPGYGIQITGSATGSNGFDATQSGQSSLFIYNQTTPAYVAVPNTDAITFDGKTAYLVYIRGDRTVDLTSQTSPLPSSNTTLRTTGSLLTGLQTYSSLANAGGFSLVTNPYASSISWNLIHNHSGTSNFNNFESYYTYMDPNIGSRGGYVTVSDAGVVNPDPGTSSPAVPAATVNIQSGQAFFVQTKTGINSPTLTIQESDKTAVNNIDVFRTATPPAQKFTASLYYNDTEHGRRLADGVTELYDDSYNAAVDGDDAVDLGNFDENIAIAKDGKLLSIEERPIIKTIDTLHLFMSNMKQQVYEYEFNPTNLNPGMIAQLVDNYTGGKTFLDVTAKTVVAFTVSSATASSASDRFYIIFRPTASGALPVTLTSVKAYQKNTGAQIEWITQQEINIDRYEVERSSDVQPFIKIGSVNAKANNSSSVINYNLFDGSPFNGINFYRIKIIDKSGKITYSQVVKVNISSKTNQVTVAPNPIHSNTIALQMNNMQKGSYTIILTNKLGQDIATKVIDHAGGSSIENITPAKVLSNGIYQLKITGNGINTTLQILKN